MNWDYLAGFFDGEGSAYLSAQRHGDCRSGFTFRPTLKIAQKDRGVLDEIYRFVGLGQVSREGKNGMYWAWTACSARQCLQIIPQLEEHSVFKRRQLALLKEACDLVARSNHRQQAYISRLIEIRKQIQVLNGMRNIANRLDLDKIRNAIAVAKINTQGASGNSGIG